MVGATVWEVKMLGFRSKKFQMLLNKMVAPLICVNRRLVEIELVPDSFPVVVPLHNIWYTDFYYE